MSEEQKRPLILFSGGLDSTALLYRALQHGDVDVITVTDCIGPEKARAEQEARTKIFSWFSEHMRTKVIRKYVIKDLGELINERTREQFLQPLMWLTVALLRVDALSHSSLQVGYVAGDQVLPYMRDMQDAWRSMSNFTKHGFVPLEFPLAFCTKKDLWDSLPEELVQLTWTCETPIQTKLPNWPQEPKEVFLECGDCLPCRRLINDRLAHPDVWEYEKHGRRYFWKYKQYFLGTPQGELELDTLYLETPNIGVKECQIES